jgi:nitrogen fixation/metabolism regulation signal transduction histidine kinase
LHLNKLDIKALFNEVLALYDIPKIKIILQLASEQLLIKGDGNMLRQVLHNLLQNAQDALVDQPSPEIMIHTKAWQNSMTLTVQDNGGGIPTEMMSRAFEPYMTTKPHGTGLGLAIVKKIVEEHRGSIKIENVVQSELGLGGAVVTITIPLFND